MKVITDSTGFTHYIHDQAIVAISEIGNNSCKLSLVNNIEIIMNRQVNDIYQNFIRKLNNSDKIKDAIDTLAYLNFSAEEWDQLENEIKDLILAAKNTQLPF